MQHRPGGANGRQLKQLNKELDSNKKPILGPYLTLWRPGLGRRKVGRDLKMLPCLT